MRRCDSRRAWLVEAKLRDEAARLAASRLASSDDAPPWNRQEESQREWFVGALRNFGRSG